MNKMVQFGMNGASAARASEISREWNSIIGKLNSKICTPSEECKLNYANVVEQLFPSRSMRWMESANVIEIHQTFPAHGHWNTESEKFRITFVIMLNEWNGKIPNPNAESVLGNVNWYNFGEKHLRSFNDLSFLEATYMLSNLPQFATTPETGKLN